MAKRTQKVGIVGKYGTRYGASLRKIAKKFEVLSHSKYTCPFCGKDSVKRQAGGIWNCKACKKTIVGGCWQLATSAATAVRQTIHRLKKLKGTDVTPAPEKVKQVKDKTAEAGSKAAAKAGSATAKPTAEKKTQKK